LAIKNTGIESFDQLLLEAIDEALSSFGENVKISIFFHLETRFELKKQETPIRISYFSYALEQIFGPGARHLDIASAKERSQSIKERMFFDDAIKCILCACCVAACPVVLKEDVKFVGPAALLRAQRYIFDSRTEDVATRIAGLETPHGIWSCKSYYKCTAVCPKKIKVTEAILKTKKKILQEQHIKKE
jgi:NAD-dependent dihydropyrimidine dehydrogenase PreA subunit